MEVRIFTSGFKSILAASILVMLIVLRQKKELINEFSLWFISVLCIGVSAITLFMSGFIVDEYNLVEIHNRFVCLLRLVVLVV